MQLHKRIKETLETNMIHLIMMGFMTLYWFFRELMAPIQIRFLLYASGIIIVALAIVKCLVFLLDSRYIDCIIDSAIEEHQMDAYINAGYKFKLKFIFINSISSE